MQIEKSENEKTIPTKGAFALHRILAPLAKHWKDAMSVEEVVVCDPNRVFLRLREKDRRGNIWKERRDESLSLRYLDTAVRAVANVYSENFNGEDKTSFFQELPEGHRFTCVRGKTVVYDHHTEDGGIALAIRNPTPPELDEKMNMGHWGINDNTKTLGTSRSLLTRQALKAPDENSMLSHDILRAVDEGTPIMVSGGTSTGKTTLLNTLMKKVNRNLRVITVEDTRELKVENHNRSHLMMHRSSKDDESSVKGLSARQMIDACMRLTPNILAISEISTQNATMALRLLKSGHSHFWTTIHAGDCIEAMDAFVDLVHSTDKNADSEKIIEVLKKKFIIIQLGFTKDKRRVVLETQWPSG